MPFLNHSIERTIDIEVVFRMRGWPVYYSPDCTTSAMAEDLEEVDTNAIALKDFPIAEMETGPLLGFWKWHVILSNLLIGVIILSITGYVLERRIRSRKPASG